MKVLVCDDDKDYLDKCSQKLLELGEKHQVELELEKAKDLQKEVIGCVVLE